MRFLRTQLDDDEAADCGRCDNCGGLALDASVGVEAVSTARDVLTRPGVVLDPRRMWPSAMPSLGVNLKGKLTAGELAEPGRAVARFTDLGFGSRVRAAVRVDEPVSDDLVRACVQVLASWGWAERPSVVLHVGSEARPHLVTSIAARLAEIGRLEDLGVVPHHGPSALACGADSTSRPAEEGRARPQILKNILRRCRGRDAVTVLGQVPLSKSV